MKNRTVMSLRKYKITWLLLLAVITLVNPGCRSAKVGRAQRRAETMQIKTAKKNQKVYDGLVKQHFKNQSKTTKKMMRKQSRETIKMHRDKSGKPRIFRWLGF